MMRLAQNEEAVVSDPNQPPPSGLNGRVLAVVGSIVGVLVLIGAIAGVLIAVLGGDGPSSVAREYLQALAQGDYAKVCLLSTSAVRDDMFAAIQQADAPPATCADYGVAEMAGYGFYVGEYGESRASILQQMDERARITTAKTHGHHAVVSFRWTTTYTGDNRKFVAGTLHGDRTQQASGTFDLVKEQGAWKVADLHWDS